MARVADWTVDEFETLLNNYGLSDEELARKLPQRSLGAIELVRDAIHSYHTDKMFISALSGMMRRRLEERHASLVCSRCGIALGTETESGLSRASGIPPPTNLGAEEGDNVVSEIQL